MMNDCRIQTNQNEKTYAQKLLQPCRIAKIKIQTLKIATEKARGENKLIAYWPNNPQLNTLESALLQTLARLKQ